MARVLFAPGFTALVISALAAAPVRAVELPSFVSPVQLMPLQDAMRAQVASADDAAMQLPSFIDTRANRTLSHMVQSARAVVVLDRELAARGAPDLTASDFPATLHSARRDAGEARALADEVSRAAELSEGLAGLPSLSDPEPAVTATGGSVPSANDGAIALAPPAATPLTAPAFAAADAGAASAYWSSPSAPGTVAAAAPPVMPRDPLPGRMSLGNGAHMLGPDHPGISAAAPAASASPAVDPLQPPAATAAPATLQTDTAGPQGTGLAQTDAAPAVPPRATLTPPSGNAPAIQKSAHHTAPRAKPVRAVAVPAPATDSSPRQRAAAAPVSPVAAPDATTAQPQATGLFSWVKPLGGKVDVPRDLTALGWASN